MNIFQEWARKVFWYLPTKEDQIKYREDMLKDNTREYSVVLKKMLDYGKQVGELQQKLETTFSIEQKELWFTLKATSQKENFEANRLRYFEENMQKLPQEINELKI